MFSCEDASFDEGKISEYKHEIANAINLYELHITILTDKLNTMNLNTNNDILQYIGYIYEYIHTNDMVSSFIINKELLIRFINTPNIVLSTIERTQIIKAYMSAKIQIPKILSHDIHVIPRFPCLDSLVPISESGIVGPSEIYIAALLNAMIETDSIIINAIKRCIDTILSKSVTTSSFQFHYTCLLQTLSETIQSGGRNTTTYNTSTIPNVRYKINEKEITEYGSLANTYLEYMKYYTPEGSRIFSTNYNTMKFGIYSFQTNTDYIFIASCMNKIIQKYGIFKKEFMKIIDTIAHLE